MIKKLSSCFMALVLAVGIMGGVALSDTAHRGDSHGCIIEIRPSGLDFADVC